MRVSELKAWLKSVEDEFNGSDPEIGIDVLAGKHIEFWSMNLGGAHFIKKDNCLSLFQVRLRSPIPHGALLKVNAETTELHASSKTGLEIDSDNKYIKSMAESASLGISKLTLSAITNHDDGSRAIVYDSASDEIVDSFTMRKDQITQIIDASQTGLNDDINKSIATLKNYLKSHEIKPYE